MTNCTTLPCTAGGPADRAIPTMQATSNARNEAMFREATTFAAHLRTVEKELSQWQRDIECECGLCSAFVSASNSDVYAG
jgi:hypothetical protein